MKKLLLAYFGTPEFSAKFLEKILKDKKIPVEVRLVVTQPDKKVGRKQVLTASAVKQVAEKNVILVSETHPESGRSWTSQDDLATKLSTVDLALVFAYGEIIPKEILEMPKYGFWNIHPSLLPKYRGPSPVAYPLINGDEETGVTIIKLDEKIDHGPIIAQKKLEILPKEKRPELTGRLVNLAYNLFSQCVNTLIQDSLKLIPQNDKDATYTNTLTKKDGYIEMSKLKDQISKSPKKLFNLFRGLYPWPGVWTLVAIQNQPGRLNRLKITDMNLIDGKIVLKKVQLEGKKEVDFKQFEKAYNIFKDL